MNHTLFRVEHKHTGIGPFQTDDAFTQSLAKKAAAQPQLPAPGDDGLGLGTIPWHWRFGCTSLEHLKIWLLLSDDAKHNRARLRTLHTKGFVLAEYRVSEDSLRKSLSGIQVAFEAAARYRVRREPLQSLLA